MAGNAARAAHLKQHQFQPGNSLGRGRPKLPEHLAHIKAFSADEISRIIAKYGRMTTEELLDHLDDRNTIVIDKCIGKLFIESLKEADYQRLSFLLDRCIGKPQVVTVDWDEDADEQLSKIPLQDLLQIVKNAIPEMSKKAGHVD